jgi:hypothetical protein
MYYRTPLTKYERISLLNDPLLDEPEDPNRSVMLCRECAAEHHAYWDERWSEYQSNLL